MIILIGQQVFLSLLGRFSHSYYWEQEQMENLFYSCKLLCWNLSVGFSEFQNICKEKWEQKWQISLNASISLNSVLSQSGWRKTRWSLCEIRHEKSLDIKSSDFRGRLYDEEVTRLRKTSPFEIHTQLLVKDSTTSWVDEERVATRVCRLRPKNTPQRIKQSFKRVGREGKCAAAAVDR